MLKQKITFFILALLVLHGLKAQTTQITGKVVGDLGEPLVGVNVVIVGTTVGTITDIDGNYALSIGPEDVLNFSFIGYISQEIEPAGRSVINITLMPDLRQLDEIVVVGYGTQKRKNIVGAVADVSGEELMKTGTINLSQSIQDRLPGVFTEVISGQPGADDASITIRGVSTFASGGNDPLILIDGVEATGGFSQLDPGEVASMSVLKDASSTAIYGVRGANGVILITTRRGRIGAPKITVAGGVTAKVMTNIPKQMGSYDVLMLGQEAIKNSGKYDGLRAQWYINNFLDPTRDQIAYPDIDWYDELIRDVGWESNARINVSGGTDFVQYFASFSANHVGDIVNTLHDDGYYSPEFTYDKYNFRTNLDFNLTNTTVLKTDISGRSELRKTPDTEVSANQFSNVFKFINEATPYLFPLYYTEEFMRSHPDPLAPNDTGVRFSSAIGETPYQENAYNALNNSGMRKFRKDVVDIQIGLQQDLSSLVEGLRASARFNYSTAFQYKKIERWRRSQWLYDVEFDTWRQQSGPGYNSSDLDFHSTGGEGFDNSNRNIYYEFKLEYQRSFNNHNVGFTGVFNRTERRSKPSVLPSYSEDWVGRASYDYNQKYILEVSAGYNGSEKFAPGKRFGFFPAAAVGWNIARETFLEGRFPWLNTLKVRYSYGKTGSERGAPRFLYQGGWEGVGDGAGYMRFGLPLAPVTDRYAEVKVANPNATWETAYKQNLGFDVALFSNELTFTVDLYKEKREGIFVNTPQPSFYHPGFGSNFGGKRIVNIGLPPVNQGKTKNQGIEVVGNYSHQNSRGFQYSIGGNFTIADSRIVDRADRPLVPDYQKQAGKPIGWLKGYKTNGFINDFEEAINAPDVTGGNKPGRYFYADFNGNGEIDNNDILPMEETRQPFITYGFNASFSYKGFDVGVRFFGKGGVSYVSRNWYPSFFQNLLSAKTFHVDRWSPDNKDALYPAFINTGDAFFQKDNDLNIVSTAYLKLQTVTIGYTLESSLLTELLRIQSVTFNLSGQNLYSWSEIPFGDPEGGNSIAGTYGNYPLVKRFMFGLNVNF
ncbi:TonB-dependent receptor [Fulvivirgaceae bacterium BMA12]|uniref:TonB-dependent receptor n=1 Tax=Agaribacillus aureus TaxID=3051825 RepID=A0ABT8L7G8_9BACT|nr:TonB-dependent receptor [Fulvivirgaceae bacterium BMA12]